MWLDRLHTHLRDPIKGEMSMTETELYEQRKTAIHLLRGGMSVSEAARELERSVSWL